MFVGVFVGGTGVFVGVFVGGTGVFVGVFVGGTGVFVGGTGVFVGVSVGGTGVLVGGGTGVLVGGTGVGSTAAPISTTPSVMVAPANPPVFEEIVKFVVAGSSPAVPLMVNRRPSPLNGSVGGANGFAVSRLRAMIKRTPGCAGITLKVGNSEAKLPSRETPVIVIASAGE